MYNLTIPSVSFSNHEQTYRCASESGGYVSRLLTLQVYVPLARTLMTPRPAVIQAGVPTTLYCESNPTYPPPTFIWTINNKTITTGINITTEILPDSGIVTRSVLARQFTEADTGQKVVCSATNGDETVTSRVFEITVFDPEHQVMGTVFGAIVAVVGVLVMVALAAWFYYKRMKRQPRIEKRKGTHEHGNYRGQFDNPSFSLPN
ncbi:uncharacterized protein LOC121377683 [Gigantopelta aegis]|uniref:uncharacterized protein LOC121377683 n=1 Tax=Gigantopelta aegis TaxID=1735272 RepID=UPI001B888EFD|nr:uncharacterized protein LOC121377683 [Gigantopelta aegis]